jgi:hypothetical protein
MSLQQLISLVTHTINTYCPFIVGTDYKIAKDSIKFFVRDFDKTGFNNQHDYFNSISTLLAALTKLQDEQTKKLAKPEIIKCQTMKGICYIIKFNYKNRIKINE